MRDDLMIDVRDIIEQMLRKHCNIDDETLMRVRDANVDDIMYRVRDLLREHSYDDNV